MLIDKVAWIRIERGAVLCARSAGKDFYYLPGGKREAGETDVETLVREITEELGVTIAPATARKAGVFEARADGRADDVTVRLTCYTADYSGALESNSEIEEYAWLDFADRDRVSLASRLVFEHLHQAGMLSSEVREGNLEGLRVPQGSLQGVRGWWDGVFLLVRWLVSVSRG